MTPPPPLPTTTVPLPPPLPPLLPPRAPPGYTALAVSPRQVRLQLTVDNRCGQSFRWRGVRVWERTEEGEAGEAGDAVKDADGEAPVTAPVVKVKAEPVDGDADPLQSDVHIKAESTLTPPPAPSGHTAWTEYSFCLGDRVVLLRQDEERGYLYHRTLLPPGNKSDSLTDAHAHSAASTDLWLRDYLNLSVPLEALYAQWAQRDPVFARFAGTFRGIRMLRQDPWECLCAFICSSNNNIARIGQMVQNLCTHFSPCLLRHTYAGTTRAADAEEDPPMTLDCHAFPPPEALAVPGTEEKLRQLGFGYRAKYIYQTAKLLVEEHGGGGGGGASPHPVHAYLASLRTLPYPAARAALTRLQGVGPKVADCILLMSLDQASSIPVDRHVFQFAAKWYGLCGNQAKYEPLAEYFRALWGEYAGWAHSVLFMADLRAFRDYDPSKGIELKKEKDEGGKGGRALIKREADDETLPTSAHTVVKAEQPEEVRPAAARAKGREALRAKTTQQRTVEGELQPCAAKITRKRKVSRAPEAEAKELLVIQEEEQADIVRFDPTANAAGTLAERVKRRRSSRVQR